MDKIYHNEAELKNKMESADGFFKFGYKSLFPTNNNIHPESLLFSNSHNNNSTALDEFANFDNGIQEYSTLVGEVNDRVDL